VFFTLTLAFLIFGFDFKWGYIYPQVETGGLYQILIVNVVFNGFSLF
jgi:hypothetical protein